MLRTCCKPRKSKDWKILHRNYTPKIFSTPKKTIFFFRIGKLFFWKFWKFSNPKFSRKYFSDFDKNFVKLFFYELFFSDFDLKIFMIFDKKNLGKFAFLKIMKFLEKYFSRCEKKSSEFRFFLGYSFDVECSNLSIYEVCSTFWALWKKLAGVVSPWYKKLYFFCIY